MRSALLLLAGASLCTARAYTDVEYSRPQGESLRFDAMVPDTPGPHPAVVIVHGGAWVTGDKIRSVRPLFDPLTKAGYAWFSINYRLARAENLAAIVSPDAVRSIEASTEDVRNAIAYVRAHASEYNIDPARIALIGESAGAQLALMAAFKPGEQSAVKAIAAFYAPSDMIHLVKASPAIPDSIRNAVKGTPLEALLLASLKRVSPREFLHASAPPMLLLHGTSDHLVPFEQSEALCKDARAIGASCQLFTVKGGGHGIRYWDGLAPYQNELTSWLDMNLL